jgi:hypothetical protein
MLYLVLSFYRGKRSSTDSRRRPPTKCGEAQSRLSAPRKRSVLSELAELDPFQAAQTGDPNSVRDRYLMQLAQRW